MHPAPAVAMRGSGLLDRALQKPQQVSQQPTNRSTPGPRAWFCLFTIESEEQLAAHGVHDGEHTAAVAHGHLRIVDVVRREGKQEEKHGKKTVLVRGFADKSPVKTRSPRSRACTTALVGCSHTDTHEDALLSGDRK